MKIKIAAAAAAMMILAGCVAPTGMSPTGSFPVIAPTDAAAVSAASTVQRNQHTGMTNVEGPIIMPQGTLLGDKYLLRSWVAPQNPAMNDRFQIQVSAYMSEWKFLSQAYANGQPLDTTRIDQSVISCAGGCSMTETVGINLTKADVERFAQSGLSFQISGQRGNVTMSIPAGYFGGVLQAHERAKTPG